MLFGGMKRLIESGKVHGLPTWVDQLQWSDQSTLPQPLKEIGQNDWLRLGICGHEVEKESFYDGLQIPGELFRPLGGWACQIRIYYTYALVTAHVYGQAMGHTFVPDYGSSGYTIRYFKLGCQHTWREIHEESHMCLHISKCSKCGMRQEIDSSD